MAYSNGSGGTLTIPSPTHPHHVDMGAAVVRSLRRSLSRSPSKWALGRTPSHGSDSSMESSNTPSPQSPCRHLSPQINTVPASAPPTAFQQQTNFSTPFRSGVKLSLRSARPKAATAKPLARTARVSPKSPLKRAFNASSDFGNSVTPPSPASEALPGQENNSFASFALSLSPSSRKNLEKPSRHSMHLDISGASRSTMSRFLDVKADAFATSTASPLKRSDAIMNLDQANLGSPVAKRRSLHGISGLSTESRDFSIFDQTPAAPQQQPPQSFDIHDDMNQEYQLTGLGPMNIRDPAPSPTPSALPRRSSSLRKSTLQQRHGDRSSWGRRQGEKHLAQMGTDVSTPNHRNRPRVSLDQFMQPMPRDSPFSAQGPLPNPSLHPLERTQHQPHPLSRTLTTSSSNSSLPDESPTHFPVQFEKPRAPLSFARSLPVGAQRPKDNRTIATPAYKNAKPFEGAFKSTGLVSKMNRNPEQLPANGPFKALTMPDTPCKKPVYPSNTYPPQSGSGKNRQRHAFSPSTPFNPLNHQIEGTFGNSDKTAGLFRQIRSGHSRKGSVLSLDGDNGDSDGGLPPTPTKPVLFKSLNSSKALQQTPMASRTLPAPISAVGYGAGCQLSDPSCKSSPNQHTLMDIQSRPDEEQAGTAEISVEVACNTSPTLSRSLPSFRRSRDRRGSLVMLQPLETAFTKPLAPLDKKIGFAKIDSLIPASPLERLDSVKNESPKTPQDTLMPPDPSRLSISNSQDGHSFLSQGEQRAVFPPATPTTRQADLFDFVDRRLSTTPINGPAPSDVDEALTSRFDKAEVVGKGEFSQVFRVTKLPVSEHLSNTFSGTPGTPPSPSDALVFAVKKIRIPFQGLRDRESKLREVNVLKAICGRPHVLQYVDSWEQNYHLYIQTEYCEEGSLDKFLKTVGTAGRLDDFRIWKILIEASMGIQSIHDAGFIHLDLKPANIFVNYEGNLKIGDFGMASAWPAARHIEGEGDREYIGPEILRGRYDKPADVFALGLIVLEMACNVFLPDNGPTWVALREGDLSVVPSLTGTEASAVARDATGMPIESDSIVSPLFTDDDSLSSLGLRSNTSRQGFPFEWSEKGMTYNASNLFGAPKRSELRHPPEFMVQADHPSSLDHVVKWMLTPDPDERPSISQVLDIDSVRWVTTHRRAGATVFEGNWGPQDDSQVDIEMTDV